MSINCTSINNVTGPQGKSKILHHRSSTYFPAITSLQECSVPAQLVSSSGGHVFCITTSAFCRKPSPQPSTQDSLPPLYVFTYSITYSFILLYIYVIYKSTSTPTIHKHIEYLHPHSHPHLYPHPHPHPYLYLFYLYIITQVLSLVFGSHHLPHFDLFIFKVDIFPLLLDHELLRDSNIVYWILHLTLMHSRSSRYRCCWGKDSTHQTHPQCHCSGQFSHTISFNPHYLLTLSPSLCSSHTGLFLMT